MAQTNPTKLSDFVSGFLPPAIAGPIFERAARQSVVMQLARQVPLATSGTSITVVTGRPVPGWVDEGAAKPTTAAGVNLVTMTPKKLAAISVVSEEVLRANPGSYMDVLRTNLADAFAVAFDKAALHDEGPDGTAAGGPFATYIDQTTKTQELGGTAQASGGIWGDLVGVLSDIVSDTDSTGRRYQLTGWAFDAVMEPALWGSVDTTGQPIFTLLPTDQASSSLATPGRVMGRPSFIGEGVASANLTSVVGYGGDWSMAAWGVIGGINYSISTEAAVTLGGTLTSLFEKNLVAIRAEAEYGFVCADVEAFSKMTNTNNTPVTSS